MQKHIEKELFLLSMRHVLIVFYFFLYPFITKLLVVPSPLFLAIIILFITHNQLESTIWFYKSRKIRKRQSGDISKVGHFFIQFFQRIEQLVMLGFVIFFINELVKGEVDVYALSLSIFLFVVIFLQHVQFYYVQIFIKPKSWFTYIPSLQKSRPSYIVRERKRVIRRGHKS